MDERKRRKSFFGIFKEYGFRITIGPDGKPKVEEYGFKITVGPDGEPKIEEFGNVKRVESRPKIVEEIEPIVDVIEEEEIVKVIAEMPGVEKEKVKVKATEDTLIIQGSDTDRKYYKEVELPVKVKPESAKATYRNGVLEVILEKLEKKSKKGVEIKVG